MELIVESNSRYNCITYLFSHDRNNKDMHLVVKSNCGIPELIDGKIEYKETTEHMGIYAKYASNIGAKIIGGCCGSTSCHIREIDKI